MRADGRNDQHVQAGLDDRAAAGEGVGGRAGRARYHDAVAGVFVHIVTVDVGREVDHAPGRQLL